MYSIPEIASQLIDENVTNDDNSKTIIFVGSKSVGKSTLIYTFLDKHDTPRETLVLDYSFGRKSDQKQGIEKNICHVWEYGGKLELFKNVATSIPQCGICTFFIMLDLSKIKSLWSRLEICLEAYNNVKQTENTDDKHELVIIGGKYDLFKNYDSEIKKVVCMTLRSIAMIHKGHLFFYSSKEPALVRKMKDILYSCGFKAGYMSKDKTSNYTKPLFIPKDTDTWESIGFGPISMEEVKMKHITRIPHEPDVDGLLTDNTLRSKRAHAEPSLDAAANRKYDELRNLDDLDMSIAEYLSNLHK